MTLVVVDVRHAGPACQRCWTGEPCASCTERSRTLNVWKRGTDAFFVLRRRTGDSIDLLFGVNSDGSQYYALSRRWRRR